tara:strand:- start:1428 stop:1877 length:450 start_codon:yes stop_codon:yes gene_type:complete
MSANTRGTLKDALSQVVSYDGGNQIGKNMDLLVDNVRDVEVIDGTSGNVTLTADQSGGVLFAGGGARTITLPTVAAGLNYKVVSTTAHAHIISGSSGTTIVNFHASASVHDSKAAIVLTSPAIGDTLEICSDGTEYYIYGDLSGLPSAT